MTPRLIYTIASALVQAAALVLIVLFGLPRFGIVLPMWSLATLMVALAALTVISYRVGSRALRKEPLRGQTGMVGTGGKTVSRLNPSGYVRIKGELWEARSSGERIDAGEKVVVVAQDGFKLTVSKSVKDGLESTL